MVASRGAGAVGRMLVAGILGIGFCSILVPSAGAATGVRCIVKDLDRSTVFRSADGSAMHRAIRAASGSDALAFSGVCVGHYVIDKDLSIAGAPTGAYPSPTLQGRRPGSVLTVKHVAVRLSQVTITHGDAPPRFGRGILNTGTLTLLNGTTVTGNTARVGAGIMNTGVLTLRGTAIVSGNTAFGHGGGIYNDGWGRKAAGIVILGGSSSVSGNRAGGGSGRRLGYGGGIANFAGILQLGGSSSVSANTASGDGGGIDLDVFGGHMIMSGSASVTGNTAARGGGVAAPDSGTLTMRQASTMSGNTSTGGLGSGGGIFATSHRLNGAVAGGNVSGNDPEDIARPKCGCHRFIHDAAVTALSAPARTAVGSKRTVTVLASAGNGYTETERISLLIKDPGSSFTLLGSKVKTFSGTRSVNFAHTFGSGEVGTVRWKAVVKLVRTYDDKPGNNTMSAATKVT